MLAPFFSFGANPVILNQKYLELNDTFLKMFMEPLCKVPWMHDAAVFCFTAQLMLLLVFYFLMNYK